MALTYPIDCDTLNKRGAYCRRALELVRLQYNIMGKWFREGISQKEYDSLGEEVKSNFPYESKLTESDWKRYKELHLVLQEKAVVAELATREELAHDNTWDIDIKSELKI